MSNLEEISELITQHLSFKKDMPCKWTLSESSVSGRGAVASEDIEAGEVLFVDRPLIFGPRAGKKLPNGCTVCGALNTNDHFKCDKCAQLLCSNDCQNTDIHMNDCDIISNWCNKIDIEDVDAACVSRALTAIRSLSLNETQKRLMCLLQAHDYPIHGTEVTDLREYFDIPDEDVELMMTACRVLDANAFEMTNPYGKSNLNLRGLFPVSAMLNHNCVPNTRHYINRDMEMVVKAAKAISAGSEIYSCYTGLLWGTPARRTHLFKTKHFACRCDRCADPTERGTYLAALKCFSFECPGCLIPVEPLNSTTVWKCLECELIVPAKNTAAVQNALGSLMGTLNFESVDDLEYFLLNRVTKYIPKTNQIVVDLQCRLIWKFGEAKGLHWHELSESRLSLKESLCRGILRTVGALAAGDAHLRGLLLYHLHAVLAERARREPDLYEELKPEIESTIEQAYVILKGDIAAPFDIELRRRYLGPGSEKTQQENFFTLNK